MINHFKFAKGTELDDACTLSAEPVEFNPSDFSRILLGSGLNCQFSLKNLISLSGFYHISATFLFQTLSSISKRKTPLNKCFGKKKGYLSLMMIRLKEPSLFLFRIKFTSRSEKNLNY